MAQQAIVETVFKSAIGALPTELGALLGQELSCSNTTYQLASKEDLFSGDSRPKSTLSHLSVVGDQEGEAFLLLPTRASIIFGGTLIMLPEDQIAENASNETLDGEVADAYGEVANILAGVLTQIFSDKYAKNLRFIRKEVEELDPSSVDVASDSPFPPGKYFSCSSELGMGGESLGRIEIIMPAALLDLDEVTAPAEEIQNLPEEPEASAVAASELPSEKIAEEKETAPATPAQPAFVDAKKIADVVLKATIKQAAEEVGALLGHPLACSDLKLEMVTKSEFFASHCLEKSVLTNFDVSGSVSGRSYLLIQLKDAILMGGTLIMLPEDEIEACMGKGEFEGEIPDAYGEVANIISGGLTQTFTDRYPQQLRFVKTTDQTITPTKLTPTDDTPFPDGLYYLASCAISLQGNALDRMHLLFPAEILGLEAQTTETVQPAAQSEESRQAENETANGQAPAQETPASRQPPPDATPVILVITDAPETAEAVSLNLKNEHYDVKVIGYKDDVRTVFSSHPVLGVFLLMSEVGEKGFSVAIKLQSSGYALPPVIAGGPEWTRSAVLKAVKYGARDILVTPATDEEIRNKANQHMSIPA